MQEYDIKELDAGYFLPVHFQGSCIEKNEKMRKWVKYKIDYSTVKVLNYSKDSSFAEHAKAMGGYQDDASYEDKKLFFKKYYFDYHSGRLQNYNKFLEKHLNKSDKVLSVASGRSANELRLLHNGYDIVCSDLSTPACYDATRKLFPDYKFCSLDILKCPSDFQYDGCICLSLIYLFNEKDLNIFFGNVSKSLNENGYLILDSAGSPDNFLSYLIHDVLLKFEANLIQLLERLKSFGKKKLGMTIQEFGYRRNDMDIILCAKKNGFELISQENYSFLNEFQRSLILKRLMKIRLIEKISAAIGKHIPYTRMFLFRKV